MIYWIAVRLPRSWRLAILKGFAGHEFRVTRMWIVPAPGTPHGFRVDHIPLEDVASKEAGAWAELLLADAARGV